MCVYGRMGGGVGGVVERREGWVGFLGCLWCVLGGWGEGSVPWLECWQVEVSLGFPSTPCVAILLLH